MNFNLVYQGVKRLQAAINVAVGLDPVSRKRLKSLESCVLEIEVKNFDQSILLGSREEQVKILSKNHLPDVVISGSALSLIKLATYKDPNLLFKRKEVEIWGDAVRAQQIQTLMKSLNIDWEGMLAEVIGDVPAHFLGSTLKSGLHWSKWASNNLIQDVEEYIKYEMSALPDRARAKLQFESIDQIRLATDRLEARIKSVMSHTEKD